MNLSEVKKLNHGDEIVCSGYLPKITQGKKYKIRKDESGDIYFTDDFGIGRLLTTELPLEIYFEATGNKPVIIVDALPCNCVNGVPQSTGGCPVHGVKY